ncbi:unnamed protein product [Trichobilharzia szidati]|nr:unnamed protein product [Trichobilharzia szidati]
MDCLPDFSYKISELESSLYLLSSTAESLTATTMAATTTITTDKVNSSSTFLITDILAPNKKDDVEHLTKDNENIEPFEHIQQKQTEIQNDSETMKCFQFDKDKSMNSLIGDNSNNAHFWNYLYNFLTTNSSAYTKQFLADQLQLPLVTHFSQGIFSETIKERSDITETSRQTLLQNIYHSQKYNENTHATDINPLRMIYSEFWKYLVENSLRSSDKNDLENKDTFENCRDDQLCNLNQSKLYWSKLCEQYLNQTQNSVFNSANNNNSNNSSSGIYIKETVGQRKEDNGSTTQEDFVNQEKFLKISNLENSNINAIQLDDMKSYKIWLQCLNSQQKMIDLYKSHHLIKNYFNETDGIKSTPDEYTVQSKNAPRVNVNSSSINSSSISSSDNENTTNTSNSSNDSNRGNMLTPMDFSSNSALDALIHMTTSTMKQLKRPGDISDEFHEQSTIQFYNKVSQTRKRRKTRTTFSNSQLSELENNFHRQKYLTPSDRDRIAKHLGLTNTQVITWFQNRRAKLKREAEELERDVMALRKQKQQKFNCFSLPVHEDDDDNDEESGEDEEKCLKDDCDEFIQVQANHSKLLTQALTLSRVSSTSIPIRESLDNRRGILNTSHISHSNAFSGSMEDERTRQTESSISLDYNRINNENYFKNFHFHEKQIPLLTLKNNDSTDDVYHGDNDRNKQRSFEKPNQIWCPALELEQESS